MGSLDVPFSGTPLGGEGTIPLSWPSVHPAAWVFRESLSSLRCKAHDKGPKSGAETLDKDRSPGPKSSIMGIPRSGAHGQTLSDVVDVRLNPYVQ